MVHSQSFWLETIDFYYVYVDEVVLMGLCWPSLSHQPLSFLLLQATHTHDAIAEAAQLMKEAVDDIMVTLNEAASEGGMVGGMVESIAESIGRVSYSTLKITGWLFLQIHC